MDRRSLLLALPLLVTPACFWRVRPPHYDAEVLASGVVVKDLVVPEEGRPAELGDRVQLHYELFLNDGTLVDSSWDRGLPIELVLGENQLPSGVEQGVVGMRRFGRRRILVPPELGYGEEGVPPLVPPRAMLRVECELMELEPGA